MDEVDANDAGEAVDRKLVRFQSALNALIDYESALENEPIRGLDSLIARKARELCGAGAAATARYDEARRELVVREIAWESETEGLVIKLIGRRVAGLAAPVTDEEYRHMMELQVGAASSLHEFSFGKVPKPLSDAIERALGIGWFRGLILASNGKLFGGIGLVGKRGEEPPRPDFLRLFAHITASAIKRREAEERVAQLLQEKDLILHEVHHRIKNNMNTMISLLSLQARAIASEEAKKALQDAEGRLQSMGVLYDRLYRAEDLRKMSLAAYLPPLVQAVVDQYPDATRVEVRTDIEDLALDVKALSLLGIIVNELVANAMKYAFPTGALPHGRRGVISVSAWARKGSIIVEVEDDGVGLPAGLSLDSSSGFGLGLVKILAEQLGGSARIERSKGARFAIEIGRG